MQHIAENLYQNEEHVPDEYRYKGVLIYVLLSKGRPIGRTTSMNQHNANASNF